MSENAILIDDDVIDPETGEIIIELPEELRTPVEKLEWLALQILEAGRQERLWKGHAGMLKAEAAKLLAYLELDKVSTDAVTIGYRSRTTRRVDPARVVTVGEMEEWGQAAIIEVVHRSACELDAETFDAVMRELRLGAYVAGLIEEKTSTWVQASERRRAAPT